MAEAGTAYSGTAKTFHWTVAALVLLMLYGGYTMTKETVGTHAGIGIVILILMLARLAWRSRTAMPELVAGMPRWQQIAAKATHHGLLALITLQPIFGLTMAASSKYNLKPFGLFGLQIGQNDAIHELAEVLHNTNAVIIAVLFALHTLAALYHHVVKRDATLKRMIPFAKA
ncbi:MAG TPA: cytochrome b [Parvibaculum sp.]